MSCSDKKPRETARTVGLRRGPHTAGRGRPRPTSATASLLVLLLSLAAEGLRADQEPIPGFRTASLPGQRALEDRFLEVPSPDSAAATARWLSDSPHLAGTAAQLARADSLAGRLRGLGFEVEIDSFEVYLPHPRRVSLELVAPERRDLRVHEEAPGGRNASADGAAADLYTVGWNAYSANGTAEAPAVYANFGLPEDYRALREAGVEVEDRIVLVRYGRSFRGVKVREAERRGAAGVVLYPDPAGDGYVAGDTLPGGPYRPARSIQRGTVSYLDIYPGDPLTPGRPARQGTGRRDPEDAENLPSIPVLPVGYETAERILRALASPERTTEARAREPEASRGPAPDAFQGGLPLPYHTGPGPAELRMTVELDYRLRPIRNVIARLPGREDREIILGNHFDAWAFGGVDPHSGTSVLMEVSRGLAALADDGWRPRRDIVLAFWDAEEFGVIGSTEYVEARLEELRRRTLAYLNVDVFTAGALDVAGAASLADLVLSAASDVTDPVTGESLADGWLDRMRSEGGEEGEEGEEPEAESARPSSEREQTTGARGPSRDREPRIEPVGAGSDWTAFLHHAGVPSLQWTMNGRGTYAVYHSNLDDFDYLATHGDSAFRYAPALARVMGLTALRLAEADALPFRYSREAARIAGHLRELEAAAGETDGADTGPENRAGILPRRVDDLRRAARALEERRERALAADDLRALRAMNRQLPAVERAFLDEEGAPGRPWYRHQIYAADLRTGYGALPLPGLAETRRRGDAAAREAAAGRLEAALRRAAAALRAAAEAAREASGETPEATGVRPEATRIRPEATGIRP